MSDLFAWDNGIAPATASQVASAGRTLSSNLSTLVTQVNAAKDSGAWDGYEEQAFQQIFENWRMGAEGIFGVLDGVSKMVTGTDEAVSKYREEIQKALDA